MRKQRLARLGKPRPRTEGLTRPRKVVATIVVATFLVPTLAGCWPVSHPKVSSPVADTLRAKGRPPLTNSRRQPLSLGFERPVHVDQMGWSGFTGNWDHKRPVVTYGVDVCLRGESRSVTITSIRPVRRVGAGYREFGAFVLGTHDEADLIISAHGGPSQLWPGAVQAAKGFTFSYHCGDNLAPDRGLQQIVVALQGTGPAGGGWQGVRIGYRDSAGARHSLAVPMEMLLCGTRTTKCGGA